LKYDYNYITDITDNSDLHQSERRCFSVGNDKLLPSPKKIALEEALASGIPIYTRARGFGSEKCNVPNLLTSVIDGYALDIDIYHLKVIKPIYIFNVLQEKITLVTPDNFLLK